MKTTDLFSMNTEREPLIPSTNRRHWSFYLGVINAFLSFILLFYLGYEASREAGCSKAGSVMLAVTLFVSVAIFSTPFASNTVEKLVSRKGIKDYRRCPDVVIIPVAVYLTISSGFGNAFLEITHLQKYTGSHVFVLARYIAKGRWFYFPSSWASPAACNYYFIKQLLIDMISALHYYNFLSMDARRRREAYHKLYTLRMNLYYVGDNEPLLHEINNVLEVNTNTSDKIVRLQNLYNKRSSEFIEFHDKGRISIFKSLLKLVAGGFGIATAKFAMHVSAQGGGVLGRLLDRFFYTPGVFENLFYYSGAAGGIASQGAVGWKAWREIVDKGYNFILYHYYSRCHDLSKVYCGKPRELVRLISCNTILSTVGFVSFLVVAFLLSVGPAIVNAYIEDQYGSGKFGWVLLTFLSSFCQGMFGFLNAYERSFFQKNFGIFARCKQKSDRQNLVEQLDNIRDDVFCLMRDVSQTKLLPKFTGNSVN